MRNVFFYKTVIGKIGIAADELVVTNVFLSDSIECSLFSQSETPLIKHAFKELTEYLEGIRTSFSLRLGAYGTDYQKKVWNELIKIPYGETRSYKQISEAMGGSFARAVGNANSKNPIPIFIPCHRVIGADGSLCGYAGGITIKRALLEIEGIVFSK